MIAGLETHDADFRSAPSAAAYASNVPVVIQQRSGRLERHELGVLTDSEYLGVVDEGVGVELGHVVTPVAGPFAVGTALVVLEARPVPEGGVKVLALGALGNGYRTFADNALEMTGTTVTMVRRVTGVFDPTTDTVGVTETEFTVPASVQDYAEGEIEGIVRSGDKKVIVAAADLPAAVTVEWKVKIGGVLHEIVKVETIWAKDQRAAFVCTARGV
jgi:hypothetical protein